MIVSVILFSSRGVTLRLSRTVDSLPSNVTLREQGIKEEPERESCSEVLVRVADALVSVGMKKEDWVKRVEILPVKSQEVECIQRGVGEDEEGEMSVSKEAMSNFEDPVHKIL